MFNITAMNKSNHTETITREEDSAIPVDQILLVIFALVLSAFIIFVNSITIVVVRRTPRLHTLSNIYVASLAATDLVVGLGLIPLSMFYIPSIRTQYYDQNIKFCVLVLGVNLGMAVVSTIHMALIASDRYVYILWPYVYQKCVGRKIIYAILFSTWSFGVFYALLPQVIHKDFSEVTKCDITIVMPIEYLFYANLSIYTVCVVIDVSMYSQIMYAAYRQRRVIRSRSVAVDTPCTTNIAVTNASQHDSDTQVKWKIQTAFQHTASHTKEIHDSQNASPNINRLSSPRKKTSSRMKSVKFFMTVFGVYFICLTPTVVSMGIDYYWTLPRFLYNMFNLLALLNSGMNFIIYFLLNARFRYAVLRIFQYRRVNNMAEITDGSYLEG